MKKYIILVMSLMIISNFAWAKSKRQMTAVNLGDQEVTLMSQATRSGERILIISDQKCGANDLCYQNKTIEGMIRVYQKSDQARYAQFYAVQNRRLQWTMMLMQEWQDYGRVDVFIDRVSDRHASAWTAYQPYDCGHQGEADTPDFDLSQVEDLLDATIYPMDESFGTQLEAKEIFAGLQSAVEIEQLISEEMSQDVSESTVTSMATAVTIYTTGRGVFNTVYGYTQKQNTFTKSIRRFKKEAKPTQANTRYQAFKKARVAMDLGYDLMSAAMFNIENSKSTCYAPQHKIIHSLL